MVSHIFNPSTREVEMGRDLSGWIEEYKARGDSSSGFSLRFHRVRLPIQCEDFIEVSLVTDRSASLLCQLSAPNIRLLVFTIKTN